MTSTLKSFMLFCVAAATLAISSAAQAKFQRLYTFCQDFNCPMGGDPRGSLLADKLGNLYGVAYYGGASGQGVAFVLRLDGKAWTYQVIYDFCARSHCADGAVPSTPLVADAAGNLYGATQGGGRHQAGTFFELSPPGNGQGAWSEKILYHFCTLADCADGSQPLHRLTYAEAAGGAPYDGQSPIYGIALAGGAEDGGALYSLMPSPGQWLNAVLHSFCSPVQCAEGGEPSGGAVLAPNGNLYGVTANGGSHTYGGVLYELSGSSYRVMHNFCDQCTEGSEPNGALALDAAGNLYGATKDGGGCTAECGTIFRFTPRNRRYRTLYGFCMDRGCRDGNEPYGDLLLDTAGNIYGTTQVDGKRCDGYPGAGIAYRLSASSFKRLHTFCGFGGGLYPNPGLAFGKSGQLYGTTSSGGDQVIFELSP